MLKPSDPIVPPKSNLPQAQLHFLNLCRNNIATIPPEIGTLSHL
jgi:hypothetical protein